MTYKIMSNEKKAKQISGLCNKCFIVNCFNDNCYALMKYRAAMKMAEWKEEQIFNALKQLGYDAALVAVKQLINTDDTKE